MTPVQRRVGGGRLIVVVGLRLPVREWRRAWLFVDRPGDVRAGVGGDSGGFFLAFPLVQLLIHKPAGGFEEMDDFVLWNAVG